MYEIDCCRANGKPSNVVHRAVKASSSAENSSNVNDLKKMSLESSTLNSPSSSISPPSATIVVILEVAMINIPSLFKQVKMKSSKGDDLSSTLSTTRSSRLAIFSKIIWMSSVMSEVLPEG